MPDDAMTPEEQASRPSDKAFALIAACASAHFYDGLCAECVDAALRTAREEEREACAQIAQECHGVVGHQDHDFRECSVAAAIRARAQESEG